MSKRSAPKKQVESKTEPEVKETVEQTKKTTKKAQKVEPVVEAPKPETTEKKPRKKAVKEEKPVEEVKEAVKEVSKEVVEVKPKKGKAKTEKPKVEETKVEEPKVEETKVEPAKKTRKVKSKDTAVKEEVVKPEKKEKAVRKAVVKKDKEPVVETGEGTLDNAELVDDEFADTNPKRRNYRHFKLIFNGSEPTGRFSGTKPKQASNKALSSIYKGGYSEPGEIKFSIVECTQGSKRKQYNYIGERVKLSTPMVVPIKKGGEKSITYNYNNKVRKDKDPIIIHA